MTPPPYHRPTSNELVRKVAQDLRLLLDNREPGRATVELSCATLARWADYLYASLLLREQEARQQRDA